MISYLLYKLGSAVSRYLPLRFTYAIARVLSDLNFLINHRSRRAVIANLTRVRRSRSAADGPLNEPLDRIARRVFHNFAFNIVDFLRLPDLDLESLRAIMDIDGWDNLEQMHGTGRGVIMLSAHLGNWEWGGALFALSGYRVKAVALDHGAGRVTRFFSERRREKGVDVLPLIGSTFAILEWLHAGGMVGLIADRDYAHQGMPVRFFGERAMMPRAHASLALKTGAAVLPCFCLRAPGGRFHLTIQPPVPSEDLHELAADERVRVFVERCLSVFEEMIASYPDQWFAFEPLWQRTQSAEAVAESEAREPDGGRGGDPVELLPGEVRRSG